MVIREISTIPRSKYRITEIRVISIERVISFKSSEAISRNVIINFFEKFKFFFILLAVVLSYDYSLLIKRK